MDLSHVSVRLHDGGWLVVPNSRPCFDGVSLDIWLAAEADLRRRFKAQTELDDQIVAQAVKDAWDLARAAGERASILSTRPTPEQLAHTEKEIGFGFKRAVQLPPDTKPINQDLTSGAIPAANHAVANSPTPDQPTPPPRRFTITD